MSINRDSAVRRLLVITYHFPPDGTVGGQRWAGLSKYLTRLGWEIHVITASSPGPERDNTGVHRHVRFRRRTLNDVYKSAVGRIRQASNTNPGVTQRNPGSARRTLPTRILAAARRAAGSSMSLPDHARGWVIRAARAARSLMSERKFDVVVTSGPPHSAHFAGLIATRGNGARFWVDMRDPWSMTHEMHLPSDPFARAERLLLRQLEKLVFPRAQKVIVNTREFGSALSAMNPGTDVTYFPNGIDMENLPAREPGSVQTGSIAYVGSLYGNRSLSSVFEAMSAILSDGVEGAANLKLDIAGTLESPHRERIHEVIAAAGLTSQVWIHGVVPRAQALELLSRSHLALVLAQDQPMCVPAKIYESVGLGVPTLVIAEENSAAACEARRIGAMTVGGSDVDGLRSVMEEMLSGRLPISIDPATPVSYADLAVHMDRLLTEAAER